MKTLLWDAINPFTGKPFTWDDPNLRWGSPSYYLEPGDPGFVPYPGQVLIPPSPQPQPKRKHMPKSDFMAKDDPGKAEQFVHFRDNIGGFLPAPRPPSCPCCPWPACCTPTLRSSATRCSSPWRM